MIKENIVVLYKSVIVLVNINKDLNKKWGCFGVDCIFCIINGIVLV
jgi:hypothetical protein